MFTKAIALFTFLIGAFSGTRTDSASIPCRDPGNISISYQELVQQSNGSAFLSVQDLTLGSISDATAPPGRKCPSAPSSDVKDGMNKRSTCPWELVLSPIRVDRYPKVLIQARCLCSRCFDSSSDTLCEQVMVSVPILRKVGCQNGLYMYQQATEEISVACTCANRRYVG